MVKKIIYIGVAIAVTAGAAYSYERVRFGERTVVFFRWVLADESDQRSSRERGRFDGRRELLPDSIRGQLGPETRRRSRPTRRGGEGEQFERRARGTGDSSETSWDETRRSFEDMPEETRLRFEQFSQERGDGDSRSAREFRDRGGRHGRDDNISLRGVAHYALILSFATMATYWVDQVARTAARARQMRKSK